MTKEDRHVMEVFGMAAVTVSNGKIVDIKPPALKYCPLFFKLRNI